MKLETPEKPEEEKAQISMLWDAVWNHIPHQLAFIDTKFNFVFVFMGLVLALLGIILGVVVFK